MKNYIRRILLGAIILCLMASIIQAREYKIATVAWIGWSPLNVAQELGFWKDLGVDVTVRNYDDPIVIFEALKADRMDLAMDMAGSLIGIYVENEDIMIVAETDWSNGGDQIIAGKTYDMQKHRNDTIGVFFHKPSCLYFLNRYLQTINMRLSDFRIVEINPQDLTAQFIARRLPVIVNYEPWATEAVKKGNGKILADSSIFKGCIPECIWGYNKKIKTVPQEDMIKILKGWIQAAKWIENPDNRTRFYHILKKNIFNTDLNLSEKELDKMLSHVIIHDADALYQRNITGGGLYQFIEDVKVFLAQNGMLKKDFIIEDIFDNHYILEALKQEPPIIDKQ